TRSASSSPGMVLAAEGIGEEIIEDLTSFFSWVIDKGSTVLQAIEDFTVEIIGDVIGFVFKIAGKIFIFWIDCLVAAGSALLNFLDWVGVDTRKVRKWLGYIFNWDDILLTHRVFKSFFTTFIDHGIQSIESYEEKLLAGMTEMEDFVKDWAGIGSRLPDAFASDSARNISAGGKPISGQDSPAFHLLNYHLKNNAGSADLPGTATSPGIPSEPGSMFSILEAGIAKLRQNFYDLMNSLDEAAYSKVGGLSFKEIIVKLTGFIGAELIEIARTIMAELFKLFNTFLEGIRDILVLPMEIPVLSYLYKSKATKGDDLSILDVACLMAAVPATVAFKIGTGANVFTAQEAEKYIQATDFSVFQADFSKPKTIATRSAAASTAHVPGAYEKWVLATAVIASVSALGLIVTSALSKIPNVEGQEIIPNNPATILTGVLYLPYVAPSIVAWFGPEPLELSDSLNIVFVSATTLKALIDVSAAAQPISATQGTWQKASSWIDLALDGLWMIPSIMACAAEKNKNPTPTFQEATAGSFFFDFSGMLSPVLVYVKNPSAMAGAVIANAVFNILYANLNGAASMRIYEGLD
ncbi:MAG: hypothetical protein ABIQ93_06010, partial [Saprospiraceae bacterium]